MHEWLMYEAGLHVLCVCYSPLRFSSVRVPSVVCCSRSCLCLPAHYYVSLKHHSSMHMLQPASMPRSSPVACCLESCNLKTTRSCMLLSNSQMHGVRCATLNIVTLSTTQNEIAGLRRTDAREMGQINESVVAPARSQARKHGHRPVGLAS